MQDLLSTDPTQEIRAIMIDYVDHTGPARQDELDHSRSGIDLPFKI